MSARKRLALFLLCLASFIAVVDTTIVTIALPSMRRDPSFSGADAQWILNGYALAFGGLVLLLLATFREHTFLNLSDYMVKIQACKVVFTLNKYGESGLSEPRGKTLGHRKIRSIELEPGRGRGTRRR